MPQLRKRLKTIRPETDFDRVLEQELYSAWLELSTLINRGLLFADNFNATTVEVADTGVINTEFTVVHSLKRVPAGYLVIGRDKAAVIYDSTTAWDETNIYLKANVANVALTVMVF